MRFYVQHSGFLRNRSAVEIMKCAMRRQALYSKLELIFEMAI